MTNQDRPAQSECCPQAARAGAFHDGEMSAAERALFVQHAAGCSECSRELHEIENLSLAFKSVAAPGLDKQRLERIHSSLRVPSVLPMAEWLGAAAAVVLFACSAWLWQEAKAPSTAEHSAAWEREAIGAPVETSSVETDDPMVFVSMDADSD